MMTPTINPAALRDFAGGGAPLLLAHAAVAAVEDLALPGLALWLATPDRDDGGRGIARLHRPSEDPALATPPRPAPPAGLRAVVAPDAAAAAPLLAALGGPPLIEAREATAALPALARLAVAALDAAPIDDGARAVLRDLASAATQRAV